MPTALPPQLIIFRHAPLSSSLTAEGLDLALLSASFGGRVTLFFCDEGVFSLLGNQSKGPLGEKSVLPTLKALALYDIDQVYVDEASLIQRGLTIETLGIPVKTGRIEHLLDDNPCIFTF
ncbi:Intracellular sulfur oxidation protein DsrF [Halomonadaceae bacterium LMG 33818]|uniref:DsrE family protein n=1 Tax=Cernens ardua TaxID=3402176 RepID=UPI003EDBD8D9